MKDNKVIYIVVLVVIGLAMFIFFFFSNRGEPNIKWRETYRHDDRQPYGTYVLYNLLKDKAGEGNFTKLDGPISDNLKDEEDTLVNYFYVGKTLYFGTDDTDTLLNFVSKGNNVFIATKFFPYELGDSLVIQGCTYEEEHYAPKITTNFLNSSLNVEDGYDFLYGEKKDSISYYWGYLEDTNCENMIELGHFDEERPNFVKVDYGAGSFYFHTTPITFTNYYLIDQEKLDYAEKVVSYLPEGKIVWDEFSRLPYEDNDFNSNRSQSESPFKFILSEPSLRWAWYLIIALALLYLIFLAKRKQRVIPVLSPNTNSSIEFAETMGRLYYQQQNHMNLAKHQMNLFLAYLRNHYGLNTKNLDEELIKKTSLKSGLEYEHIEIIFKGYKKLEFIVNISVDHLIEFHERLDYFYKNCK
ncbi:MAG: DUF4350 domain-containing protein [Bacteroidota bacterium]